MSHGGDGLDAARLGNMGLPGMLQLLVESHKGQVPDVVQQVLLVTKMSVGCRIADARSASSIGNAKRQ